MTESLDKMMDLWAGQRSQRERIGDRLDQVRAIDHVIYFRSSKKSRRAAESLTSRGFAVSVVPSLFRTRVEATRTDALTDSEVARFLGEILAIVESHGGRYDGFGGPVIPAS
jgi:hypothetical protein